MSLGLDCTYEMADIEMNIGEEFGLLSPSKK